MCHYKYKKIFTTKPNDNINFFKNKIILVVGPAETSFPALYKV